MENNTELLETLELIEELKNRQSHQFIQYTPLSDPDINQLAYHQSKAWCRLVFGGNRSGKSRVTAQEIAWWCTEKHPYQKTPKSPRIWVIAPEYRVIFEGVWGHLKNILPYWEIKKKGVKVPNWEIPTFVEFKNGARIDFISAEGGESDRKKIQAAEVDLICIDEEVSGDLRDEIMARLVTKGGRLNISATLVSSEEWILELEEEGEDPKNDDVEIFRFNTTKNTYNNEQAIKRWLTKLSDEEKEVRIFGRARKGKGIIYKPSPNFWIPRFEIPKTWTFMHSFDPGHRIAAALWFAIAPDNFVYIFKEMYLMYTSLKECVDYFKAVEGWREIAGIWQRTDDTIFSSVRVIDKAAFNTPADGSLSIADKLFVDHDLQFIPSTSNKDVNIEDVRRLLLPAENPRMKAFDDLENLRKEMRHYRIKEIKRAPDRDMQKARPLKQFDHLMNSLEYASSHGFIQQYTRSHQEQLLDECQKPDDEIEFPTDKAEYRKKKWQLAIARRKLKQQTERDD